MGKPIVLDLETKKSFREINSNDPGKLGVSVVGTYSYETDTYKAYREEKFRDLFSLIENSSLIVGFNIVDFDLPALNPYYPGNLLKFPAFDILADVKNILGRRIALDEFAKETLKIKKSGHGLQAIDWYNEGKWDDLCKYCLDDVRITKDLYEFGKQKGSIYYLSPFGRKEIKVSWNTQQNPKQEFNLTLGL